MSVYTAPQIAALKPHKTQGYFFLDSSLLALLTLACLIRLMRTIRTIFNMIIRSIKPPITPDITGFCLTKSSSDVFCSSAGSSTGAPSGAGVGVGVSTTI